MPAGAVDFNVVIAASAPAKEGGLVHAVTVIQPVQTWTVIRGQDDFSAVADSLSSILTSLPPCPKVATDIASTDVDALVTARNALQQWLTSILMYPGARESPALRNFLTYAANMIPPQYENVPWTMFAANGQVANTTAAPSEQPEPTTASPAAATAALDDMVMDDMFDGGDELGPLQHDETDDEEEYRPSIRYKPTDEPLTEEDEMEIAQMAGEVEMIEDVGSLAQSMGASHLGRSLMLQEEMSGNNSSSNSSALHRGSQQRQSGLQLGMAVSGMGRGGIGSAMENATGGLGGGFRPTVPESPPRLDAFKMIKVIGKGSFGKSSSWRTKLVI